MLSRGWQRRPLEESSSRWSTTGVIRADGPRLFTGSPPARLTSRSGRGMDGSQARGLSIWAPGPGREPPSRAARVRPCRHNRSVSDVLIVEGAPPAPERSAGGMRRARRACLRRSRRPGPRPRSPPAQVPPGSAPLDAVRLLPGRAGRSRPLSRPTCTAPHQEAAWQALTDFSESDIGAKHPSDGDDLGAGLGAIHPFFLDSPADAQACHLSPTSWEVPPPPTVSRLRATSCTKDHR